MRKLRRESVPYAVATVVRTMSSTAAKPGMKAVLLESGEFAAGWLGGRCVTGAVRKAAIDAIRLGTPKLVILRPEEILRDAEELPDDARVMRARNGCPSKGSLDIFVEPVMPFAEMLIFGCGPVADALSKMAGNFGFRLVVCGPRMAPEISERAAQTHDSIEELAEADNGNSRRYIVIATQGRGDLAALKAAIQLPACYRGFIASRRKFASMRLKLADSGVQAEDIDSIKSPAGLDIHAVTPEEIALSILAEMISVRRSRSLARGNE